MTPIRRYTYVPVTQTSLAATNRIPNSKLQIPRPTMPDPAADTAHDADEPSAFLNGKYVRLSEMQLSVTDMGVVYGAAATEMLRTFSGKPAQVDEHLNRLNASLAYLGITPPLSTNDLIGVIDRLVTENFPRLIAGRDLGVVVFITAGHNLTYLGPSGRDLAARPTVGVHTFELPFELWTERFRYGQHLVVPSVPAMPIEVIDPRFKIRSRAHWYLADRDARRTEPNASALLIDGQGHVTETSSGNLCVISDGVIRYPNPARTLPGIALKTCCQIAEELGIPHQSADLTPDDIAGADEAWTTSTPYCMLPVTHFHQRRIADGKVGPLYQQVLAAWSAATGTDLAGQLAAT